MARDTCPRCGKFSMGKFACQNCGFVDPSRVRSREEEREEPDPWGNAVTVLVVVVIAAILCGFLVKDLKSCSVKRVAPATPSAAPGAR